MARPAVFNQDRGIYGKVELKGYKTRDASPFVIFKNEGNWQIGQERTGLSVMAMIPVGFQRSKRNLLTLVEMMEREIPDEVTLIGLADGFPMHASLREAGKRMIAWVRQYVGRPV